MSHKIVKKMVAVPRRIFESLHDAYEKLGEFSHEFEDFSLSRDKNFVKKMRESKQQHKAGETRDFSVLKKKYHG